MKAGTNFDYLKDVDKNLYEIITEAENLYRGEFFEQCVTQTRRFGEHICRNVLGQNRTSEITFDEMLATLKDKIQGFEQEKEFIKDLYFLKKCGNEAVHSGSINKNAITALECLQRAFEVGLNYSVYNKKADRDILKLNYDIDLLITGKKTKKSLSERYKKVKTTEKTNTKIKKKNLSEKKQKKAKKQVSSMKSVPRRQGITPFWMFVILSLIIAFIAVLYLTLGS